MTTIIRYFEDKINTARDFLQRRDVLTIVVVLCVAFSSFALGVHAASDKAVHQITKENNLCTKPVTEETLKESVKISQNNKTIVASRNGTKYYFSWCSGVSRIAAQNRVYFETVEEAEMQGLTLGSNCK